MTVTSIVWDPIFDSGNAIALDVAKACIKLMLSTAVVAERDFIDFNAADMVSKVAYVNKSSTSPNFGVNYMKVRTGRDVSSPVGSVDVAIIYTYLNHRSAWGTSVGFNSLLVPYVSTTSQGSGNVNDAKYPYVILATAIASQLKADLLTFTPIGSVSYIYDDVDHADPSGQQPSLRRVTPIGELGWVAQHNSYINTSLFSMQTVVETAPYTSTGLYIPPGYYRPGDTQVVITTLTTI